jgi:hypothetical protein
MSWLAATVLTGIVSGFYLSHALVLGALFTWLADPARSALLWQTYSEFRKVHPPGLYLSVIGAQIIAAIVFAALSVWRRSGALPAVIAAILSLAIIVVQLASGFSALEVGVVSGTARSPEELARFARWNVPIHVCHASLALVAFLVLAVAGAPQRPGRPTGARRLR